MGSRVSDIFISISFSALSLIGLGGCSNTDEPVNLEPVIIVLDATEITRTDAVLNARIERQQGSEVSFLYFKYGKTEDMELKSEVINNPSGVESIHISNLTPGATYYFRAEGGRGDAVFTSQTLAFTTLPNSLPTVSAAKILSSGPTAIIISFEIAEDGGEALTEAGCYITNLNTNTTIRQNMDMEFEKGVALTTGTHQMLLKSLTPLSDYSITPFASNTVGECKGETMNFSTNSTINLSSAGHLSYILGNNDFHASSIAVSGPMNGDDFRFLRHLLLAPSPAGENFPDTELTYVDLSDVKICEGGVAYDGSRYTEEDVVTTGLFSNCKNLHYISLPFTAVEIQRESFEGCQNLHNIIIPAKVKTLLPSSGCAALESIGVSEANQYYTSIDGVLYNKDVTEILWFPEGKTGEYSLPESITYIKENAFRGTKITSIRLPDTLKEIARGAFSKSAIAEIYLPVNMTNVSEGLFQDCETLRIVHFGEATQFFGNYVFDGCPLEHLYLPASVPPYVSTNSFSNNPEIFKNCILHVPKASKAIYRNNKNWGKFEQIVEL